MPADALVHLHLDGSVMVLTGATEMGQGVHTKLMQIAAQSLGVPITAVNTIESNTYATPTQPVTGGSMGTGKLADQSYVALLFNIQGRS